MTFQPGLQNPAGGISYDDALQLLFLRQPSNNQYPPEPVNFLPQLASTPYQVLESDYTRLYGQSFSEDPSLRPPPRSDACQQEITPGILSSLDELKQGISSIQTKCDNLSASVSELQDWMKASIDEMREYIERHRAWSLHFKRAVESQMKDRPAGSEDSAVESQGS